MSIEITIPKLGFSMESGTIREWLLGDGDFVKEGQSIYLIELDKSTTEVEAPASGVLRISGELDVEYPIGAVIGFID